MPIYSIMRGFEEVAIRDADSPEAAIAGEPGVTASPFVAIEAELFAMPRLVPWATAARLYFGIPEAPIPDLPARIEGPWGTRLVRLATDADFRATTHDDY